MGSGVARQGSVGRARSRGPPAEDVSAAQPAPTLSRVQALLALDRLTLPIQAEVLAQHRLPSISEDVRRRLWHAVNDLARWLAYTYEQAGSAARRARGNGNRRHWPRPASSRGCSTTADCKPGWDCCITSPGLPGNWKILHNAYREACAQGVATEPFAGRAGQPGDGCSAEQEYLQILLLQRVNSGNLTADQVEWAAQWLRTWARMLKLSEPAAEGDGLRSIRAAARACWAGAPRRRKANCCPRPAAAA